MTTEIELQDAPAISFDIARAQVAKMLTEAAGLTIAGPDDRDGFNAVAAYRQAAKKQRVAVDKKAKELKAPHIAYNRSVDARRDELTVPLAEIEGQLSQKEKAYNDERDRIAEERAQSARLRYQARVRELQAWGFQYNVDYDAFSSADVIIIVDDIKALSDEDYAPSRELAREQHQANAARLELESAELARQSAELQAQAEKLAAERAIAEAELSQLQSRLEIAERKTEQSGEMPHAAQEGISTTEPGETSDKQEGADTGRQKRQKMEKDTLRQWLENRIASEMPVMSSAETAEFAVSAHNRMAHLVSTLIYELESL